MLLTSPIDSSIVGVCSVHTYTAVYYFILPYTSVNIDLYYLNLQQITYTGPSSISQYTSMYIIYAHVHNVYGTTNVNWPILLYTLTRTVLYYVDSQ